MKPVENCEGRTEMARPKLGFVGIPPIHDEAVDGWGTLLCLVADFRDKDTR